MFRYSPASWGGGVGRGGEGVHTHTHSVHLTTFVWTDHEVEPSFQWLSTTTQTRRIWTGGVKGTGGGEGHWGGSGYSLRMGEGGVRGCREASCSVKILH